jgi:hypothetical protein
VLHKNTLIAFAAAVALGCIPVATTALAAGHPGGHAGGGHAMGGHAMAGPARGGPAGYGRGDRIVRSGGRYYGGGPVYDSCPGNGYGPGYGYGYSNGCPGYGVPVVGGVINGILGGDGY